MPEISTLQAYKRDIDGPFSEIQDALNEQTDEYVTQKDAFAHIVRERAQVLEE